MLKQFARQSGRPNHAPHWRKGEGFTYLSDEMFLMPPIIVEDESSSNRYVLRNAFVVRY
jgi:hypothetical protein